MNQSNKLLSDLVTFRSYAKHLSHAARRETLEESINRDMNMHLQEFPQLSRDIIKAFQRVHELKVMPSMRGLQFAGDAVLKNHIRQYNCSYMPVDSPRAFSESFYISLSGTGVGYSVQRRHISKLPKVRAPKEEGIFTAHDSIMGWAQCIEMLVNAYFYGGVRPVFDLSKIRPKGSYLVTTGAKAPGPEPLRKALELVENRLKLAVGRNLTSLECHDIMCIISDAVVSGGIRRAALIVLFDRDDVLMLRCKHGDWWNTAPWRARANNSVVLPRGEVTKEEFDYVFQMCKDSNAGEPGFFWTDDPEGGTNPSLRAGTKIVTGNGVFPIEKLADTSFIVPNLNGQWSKAKCWKSGENIPLYELTLDTGEKYYSSPEHKWPIYVNGRYIKCQSSELKEGDLLPVNVFNRESLFLSGTKGTRGQGFLIGWLYGDGSITVRSDTKKKVCSFIVSDKDGSDVLDKIKTEIFNIDNIKRIHYKRGKCSEFQVGSPKFLKWLEYMGVEKKEFGLPSGIWTDWTEECRRGFIDGLISSDGHVPKDSHGISLVSSKIKLIKDVQDLLGFYGIKSSLTKRENKNVKFPNGKVYEKTYTNYILRTTVSGRKKFQEIFNLSVKYKQTELERPIKTDEEFIKLRSVRLTNIQEDVWDISVYDDTHCFQLPQVTTGNCCEIALNPYQFCNLTSVSQTNITSEKDFLNRIYAASLIGTLQAAYTNFDYIRPEWKHTTEREALLGISFTGIADAGNRVSAELLRKGAALALEVNEKYSKKIGINMAARIGCIKPEGTMSAVVGSSSGIHARHDEYYIRTIRIDEDSALASYLKSVIPELIETDIYAANSLVVSIPQESPKGSIIRSDETALSLLDRALFYRKNWIEPSHRYGLNKHNVSVTISVKENEWDSLRESMWENRNSYSGISLLPYDTGTYQQAPFQSCTKEKYEEMSLLVKDIDLKMVREEQDNTNRMEILACSGGLCELPL